MMECDVVANEVWKWDALITGGFSDEKKAVFCTEKCEMVGKGIDNSWMIGKCRTASVGTSLRMSILDKTGVFHSTCYFLGNQAL